MVLGGSVGGWVGEYVLVRVCVVCVVLCCVVVCLSGCVLCVVSLKIKWSSTASSGKAFGTCGMPKKKATRIATKPTRRRQTRSEVRQDMWNKHFQSTAMAVSEASRRVEEWENAGPSTAGWNRN